MLKVVYEISEPLQIVLGEVRPELIFTMKELEKIELLENVLRPVSKGSATLGSDFATLMSAESCHKYMIKELKKIDNPIAYEIKESIMKRYLQRRSKTLISLMFYLNDYEFKLGTSNGMFSYSSKKEVQKLGQSLMERLFGLKTESMDEEKLKGFKEVEEDDKNILSTV